MILVFDLDDTLYEEITYVESAFRTVANYLSHQTGYGEEQVFADLMEVLKKEGRGKVFNNVLKKYGIYSKAEVRRCLGIYRNSKPDIQLKREAVKCLERFGDLPKYVVTDGNKMVQSIKIQALKLDRFFRRAIPTHNYGIKHAKPSTHVFHKILKWENACPSDLAYIGDNPNKDFVNLKKEGFKTVRVRTGMFKDLSLSKDFEAHCEISSFNELDMNLLNKLFNKKNED